MSKYDPYYADYVLLGMEGDGGRSSYVFYVDVPDKNDHYQRLLTFSYIGDYDFQSEEEWHNFTVSLWIKIWSALSDEARSKNIDPTLVWLDKEIIYNIMDRWKPKRKHNDSHVPTNPVVVLE